MAIDHPWMPFYVRDWLEDREVMAMPRVARSMYFDILCHIWIGGPLPDDCAAVARILRVSRRSLAPHWTVIRGRLAVDSRSKLTHQKLESLRSRAREKAEKSSNAAKTRWSSDADALPPTSNADAMPSESQSQSQSHKEPEEEQKKQSAFADGVMGKSTKPAKPKKPKAETVPLPFKLDVALDALAAGGRFVKTTPTAGQCINTQRLIREFPTIGTWTLVGLWLGAGGDSWRESVDVRALKDFATWVGLAQKWDQEGRRAVASGPRPRNGRAVGYAPASNEHNAETKDTTNELLGPNR